MEQGYGPSEEEFDLLQRTIRKQIDEGEIPEHLVERWLRKIRYVNDY